MSDFRALCEELLHALEVQLDELRFDNRLCKRARAALASAPAPVVGDEIPNNCWLDDDVPCPSPCVFDDPNQVIENCTFATMLLHAHKDKTDCPHYRATPGTAPAPVVGDDLPPRVGHILRLAEIIREAYGNYILGAVDLAEAILSHPGVRDCGMGTDPAPAPVPVSKRLPSAEDCDAWYEFSVFNEDDEEQAGGSGSDLEALRREAAHYHAVYSQDGPHTIQLRRVEVLPATTPPEETP